ncbi:MAG: hypothetical protein HYZ28_05730 [Myxococcales bacterium]|nr:hypothetical protein [Myxococcales bacterium]
MRFTTRAGKRAAHTQVGAVFADGVGKGKTWEALAGTAELLLARGKLTRQGGRRQRKVRLPRHILILVPPGLVSKWRDELGSEEKGVRQYLSAWARRKRAAFVQRTFERIVDIQTRAQLVGGKVRTTKKWTRKDLAPGVYIVNVNLIAAGPGRIHGNHRARRLFTTHWDTVIVDEAHHRSALEALKHLDGVRRRKSPSPLLLLSATPFQLSLSDMRHLFDHVVASQEAESVGAQLLRCPTLEGFLQRVADACRKSDAAMPSARERRDAERLLSKLVARSKTGRGRRCYFSLAADGTPEPIPSPWAWTDAQFDSVRPSTIKASPEFLNHYLEMRLALAERAAEDFFAPGALRQFLSTFEQFAASKAGRLLELAIPKGQHPKLAALRAWFERTLSADIDSMLDAECDLGLPRKTIVFLFHRSATQHVLEETLADVAAAVFTQQIGDREAFVRRSKETLKQLAKLVRAKADDVQGKGTRRLHHAALANRLDDLAKKVAAHPHLVAMLGNPRRAYADRVRAHVKKTLDAYAREVKKFQSVDDDDEYSISARKRALRLAGERIRDLFSSEIVAGYTGGDADRDGNADRFRSPLFPWLLIASNVGAEGIDLQTYTRHLVHYELEWNPAKLEQREGRGDRTGRVLHGALRVYFPLVASTYEERILHQLVVRMRWHGVLLGKSSADLAKDDGATAYRKVATTDLRRLQLDLTPRSS